ncbi:M15 family metallopeptidase [Cellulomonas sp. S1-8]|uniref:M15 family metallopeptidase n=1 Tax=Cellulomonas sp. S1-8 TaxID=2904790 RepID=UPI002244BAB8|nr:M15 family metallopeptidase [Cellulomonas sp. S1-8]UZN03150.1 M15 family metallopeptidase [Cellulomonas sp. S1-8]
MTATGLVLAATSACSTPGAVGGATPAPTSASTSTTPQVTRTPDGATADPSPGTPPAPEPVPTYQATVSALTPELAARMHASWRPGCPVPLEDLRHVALPHRDMTGGVVQGELVVHVDVADGVVEVFRTLFDAGYPIASMRLVDDFGADDDASMAADNTSAFNCRAVTGGTGWSEHSFGRAIDVNPVENPYVHGSTVLPSAGAAFVDRPDAPGVIHDGDVVVAAFAAHGWQWGGHWTRPIDYQHFSTTGR